MKEFRLIQLEIEPIVSWQSIRKMEIPVLLTFLPLVWQQFKKYLIKEK
jgi:hypothetical protein